MIQLGMNNTRFIYNILVQVELDAPDSSAADEAVNDYFGEGSFGGADVVSMEVLDSAELR